MGQLLYQVLVIGGCLIGGLFLCVMILVGFTTWLDGRSLSGRKRADD
jgi:hypothetical protein